MADAGIRFAAAATAVDIVDRVRSSQNIKLTAKDNFYKSLVVLIIQDGCETLILLPEG